MMRELKPGEFAEIPPRGDHWQPEPTDIINHPPHYTATAIEPIDVIEAWNLGFCLGNAVKYIARHEHKGSTLADLKKARWYLDRHIAKLEQQA